MPRKGPLKPSCMNLKRRLTVSYRTQELSANEHAKERISLSRCRLIVPQVTLARAYTALTLHRMAYECSLGIPAVLTG